MKKFVLLFFLSINLIFIFAQEKEEYPPATEPASRVYLGVEIGIKTFDGQASDYEFIREAAVYYYGYYSNYSEISLMTYAPFVALKAEYRLLSDKFWLSAGVQYASMTSKMGKISHSGNNSDYLYIMLDQNLDDIYYYRVKEIEEKDHYIGIPIDIRYSPFIPRYFRLYFKAGFEVNFKVASQQNVVFYDSEMKDKEGAILDLFDQPGSTYSTGTLGVGIQLGKQDKPNFRIEADFPTVVFTQEAFAFMDHSFGGGVRMSFVLPLKKK